MRLIFRLCLIALIAMLFIPPQPPTAHAQSSITACPNQSLLNGFAIIILPGNCTLPATLTIINNPSNPMVTIRGNGYTLTAAGGSRHFTVNAGGRLTLDNVTLAGGSTSSNGGSIYNPTGGVVVIQNNSVLRNNRTTGHYPSGGFGGAIFNDGGIVLIKNSTLSSNSATHAGGAIFNQNGGILTVKDYSTLTGNSAGVGGAIYNGAVDTQYGASDVAVINTLFSGNSATTGGAIVNASESTTSKMYVGNSTFSGNSASNRGGALSVGGSTGAEGPTTIRNNTFSGNRAFAGGAIDNDQGTVTANNNIAANSNFSNCAFNGGSFSAANNLSTDGSCGSGFAAVSSAALQLGPLQYNGGATQTMALLPGSPALDGGVNSTCVDYNGVLLTTDQRGRPRPVGARCDIGAFEFNPHQLTVTVSGSGTVTSGSAGIDCGADCDELFDGTVTLTAAPAAMQVVAWGGCTTASGNTCTVDMSTSARTVTATFSADPYTITVTSAGTGSGTITSDDIPPTIDCGATCVSAYPPSTTITLTAAANPGSLFAGWSGPDGVGCGAATTCTVTVDQTRAVTATFNLPDAAPAGGPPPGPPIGCDRVSYVGGWGIFVECTSEQTAFTVAEPPAGYTYFEQPPYVGYGDVFTIGDHSPLPVMVCWDVTAAHVVVGVYHDQPDFSRTWTILPVTLQDEGLCANLPVLGNVALLTSEAPSSAAPAAESPVPGPAPVSCEVTTTHIVHFRATPAGDVLTRIPYQTSLTATAMQGDWYQVEWLGQTGWISASYVTAICD